MDNTYTVIRPDKPEEHYPSEGDLYIDNSDDEVFIVVKKRDGGGAKVEYVAVSLTRAETYNGWCLSARAAVDGLEFLGDNCEVTVKSTR